jgi:hypothetical protein
VRRFIGSLDVGDDSCASAVPPVRLVARFARRAVELEPARGLEGNAGTDDQLRVVSAALMTSEDVIVRVMGDGAWKGVGLRGGSFQALEFNGGSGYRAQLRDVQWTEDVSVSGTIQWPARASDGAAKADLVVAGTAGARGTLTLQWTEGAVATARGALGGKPIVAEAPAP